MIMFKDVCLCRPSRYSGSTCQDNISERSIRTIPRRHKSSDAKTVAMVERCFDPHLGDTFARRQAGYLEAMETGPVMHLAICGQGNGGAQGVLDFSGTGLEPADCKRYVDVKPNK